jgi:hypothetical protein
MSQPILVHGSDLHFHYCKYNRSTGPAYRLYKEWLIASFIPVWGFYSSAVQLIQVQPEHLPDNLGIKKVCFDMPCFALQQAPPACTELDKQTVEILLPGLISPTLKDDFLRLCFFDIWVANEDRNHNNYNIILVSEKERYRLFPIDHEACFNHGELRGPLTPITFEESLIYSAAFAKLYKAQDLRSGMLDKSRNQYYIYMGAAREKLLQILHGLPNEWQIDIVAEQEILARFLFDDTWFNQAWETFLDYIRLYLEQL